MPKPRAYSRYLFRERHKKQYVLTKTKLVVGFCLSLMGSVFVGSYFEKYGPVIIHQSISAIRSMVSDRPSQEESQEEVVTAAAAPSPTPEPKALDRDEEHISSLENRVKSIQFSSEAEKRNPVKAEAAESPPSE